MNRIESPRTDDNAIEQEIKDKGLTAPRVTPDDITDSILSAYFFTALEAADRTCNLVRACDQVPLSLLTLCVLTLRNGFTVTGESACASPENFDPELGKKIARANAVQKIWPLMGYALKEKLANAAPVSAPSNGTMTVFRGGGARAHAGLTMPLNTAEGRQQRGLGELVDQARELAAAAEAGNV